jgi:hypothetical protein
MAADSQPIARGQTDLSIVANSFDLTAAAEAVDEWSGIVLEIVATVGCYLLFSKKKQ